MAISLHCSKCKSGAKIGAKQCKKCDTKFTSVNRKYRVTVKLANGKRKSKIAQSIESARKIEAKLKTISIEGGLFKNQESPPLSLHTFEFYWSSNEIKVATLLDKLYYLYLLPVGQFKSFMPKDMKIISNPVNVIFDNCGNWNVKANGVCCNLKK